MNVNDEVLQICDKLNEYEKNNSYHLFALLCLRSKATQKFINKFIETSDVDDEVLDVIKTIIISAKTVYEDDRYCDPFPDILYDRMLSKYKLFRDEPYGNNSIGLANSKYKYDVLSGTLDKVHFVYNDKRDPLETRGSLEDYIMNLPTDKDFLVFVNEKKDGTSVTIDYKLNNKGFYVPKSAISRGKKDYGEGTDVSSVMPDVKVKSDFLKQILGFAPKYIGIQYEMLVSNKQKKQFENITGQKFANNRSAVSGLLRRIVFSTNNDELVKLKKCVSLVPVGFDILDEYVENKSYYDISWEKLYLPICKYFIYGDIGMNCEEINGSKKEILRKFEELSIKWNNERTSLNHAIDGIVLTICNRELQRKLGRKGSINQYQIAYKFPEESYKTHIRDYEITTGRFGFKEILLKVDPVRLNGTLQGKAQIHSLNKFKKFNPRIGDEIILKLSSDVIPYGYYDDTCIRNKDGKKIHLPTTCECGTELIEEKNKLRCPNPKCPYRVVGGFVTFFSELNAKGIGEKTCYQLYDELGITKPSQILKLSKSDFLRMKGFKDASAQLCMDTINDILTKPRTPDVIISSLGIDCLRSATARKILDYINLDDLLSIINYGDYGVLDSTLRNVDGIDNNAKIISTYLIEYKDELNELLKLIPIKKIEKFSKSILISGMRNDNELIMVANKAGYDVIESGSNYDILVIKDESIKSSKVDKAHKRGKPIMTKREFINKFSI